MKFLRISMVVAMVFLSWLMLPGITTAPIRAIAPVMASYNPPPANRFHAPISAMGLVGLANATKGFLNLTSTYTVPSTTSTFSTTSVSAGPSVSLGPQTIRQNALRFINDNTAIPQSETSVATDPNNSSRIVGGYNDANLLLCGVIPIECDRSFADSLTGFTISDDGGHTVAKSEHIPDLNVNGTFLVSWGDPSVAASTDGNFFFASLAFQPANIVLGNGILIAKSNSNLFNRNVPCTTSFFPDPTFSPCWNARIVFAHLAFPTFTVEDKDRIAVDRDPSSPFYGSVYIGWDHFAAIGTSSSYLARCDGNLVACTMVSGGDQPALSGEDLFTAWTTPVVDKNGNVGVAWCNFGTFITFGPVVCKIRFSPPGGLAFGQTSTILSYMGTGTMLPDATVIIGWATEQFRTGPGLISIAADTSALSSNIYFTTQVCTFGHYFVIPRVFTGGAADNPGDCGRSTVLFSTSTDGGASWSSPISLSRPSVNDQSFVTVDPTTGQLYVLYYSTQFDPFDHLIDVVTMISNNAGQTFHQIRVTKVSNEPNSDPNMYNYLVPAGLGSSFIVPQYGDYFEGTAINGSLVVLFTGNYAVEKGTFQTDPFLAIVSRNG